VVVGAAVVEVVLVVVVGAAVVEVDVDELVVDPCVVVVDVGDDPGRVVLVWGAVVGVLAFVLGGDVDGAFVVVDGAGFVAFVFVVIVFFSGS
jgi:hypothetical protein